MHLAALTGQWRVLRWLVVAGAKVNSRNLRGDSPLHVCARNGDVLGTRAVLDPVSRQERDRLRLRSGNGAVQRCDLDQWNYEGEFG